MWWRCRRLVCHWCLDQYPMQRRENLFFLVEDGQEEFVKWFQEYLSSTDAMDLLAFNLQVVIVDYTDEKNIIDNVCNALKGGVNFIIDASWSGFEKLETLVNILQLPYIRIDLSIGSALDLLDRFLDLRNSSDVVVIFDDQKYVDQALFHWIDSPRFRMVVSDQLDDIAAKRLKNMRPMPNSFAIVASSDNMKELLQMAFYQDLVKLPERWHLVFLDHKYDAFNKNGFNTTNLHLLKIDKDTCCQLQNMKSKCICADNFIMQKQFLSLILDHISTILKTLVKDGYVLSNEVSCYDKKYNTSITQTIQNKLNNIANNNVNFYILKGVYQLKIKATIEKGNGLYPSDIIAKYDDKQNLQVSRGFQLKPVKTFYRIGTTYALPWSFYEKDKDCGKLIWTGYCIDFIKKLSELMDFDYELVIPQNGTFGAKISGIWDGVVGDLARGETDIAIAALIMTADREEVVDFVAPYFEQVGITIVMRKPAHKTSLFKFMTVLKLEVWLSIVAALVVTAFMIWFLDKYSPYSARNNKVAYPYECRNFSLKESFWFALTSFTPQGGGEAPKSLSARTLVAAYWLFVVLMLATFTANLAAFLTVERMQTPVQSLEQLGKQSRINYTVVSESNSHQYFINMKNAEDTLYRMWKELTLNASTDDAQYRVWDYPIREQYGHILIAINDSNPVVNASEGFRIVNERLEGDFAFIHDSAEIKYEISRNCNLTEVGDIFAEKPYAIAVQQGSHLQDEISIKILDLQRDRFFEELQAKYWNNSLKGDCSNEDESGGITLESLGGVFIATLFGLVLAMITLAIEVIYYKRKIKKGSLQELPKQDKAAQDNDIQIIKFYSEADTITIGTKFKPVTQTRLTPKVSRISVYPRYRLPSMK